MYLIKILFWNEGLKSFFFELLQIIWGRKWNPQPLKSEAEGEDLKWKDMKVFSSSKHTMGPLHVK